MSNAETQTLTLVIPVYNEASVIAAHLSEIVVQAKPPGADYEIELLIVDDGSTDGTPQVLAEFCRAHPFGSHIGFTRNFGKEAAIQAGLDHARGDAVVVLDSDLQHPPALIPRMVELWRGGARVVEAYKTHRGRESVAAGLLANGFYRVFRRIAGLDLHGQSDYKLLDRVVVEQYRGLQERQRFFRGLIHWMHFPAARVPFEVPERAGGDSRWSRIGLLRYALRGITAFSSAPLALVTWCGFLTLIVGAAFGALALIQKMQGDALDGFTTVILLQTFFSGALMLSLGIVGHYLARIYDEIKGRPGYILHPPATPARVPENRRQHESVQ